jgi:ParB family chromosome partitioning protein
VRETEELARKMSGDRPVRRAKTEVPPEVSALENRIRDHLGTRVQLHHTASGHGSLSIYYFSEEELNALIGKILNE